MHEFTVVEKFCVNCKNYKLVFNPYFLQLPFRKACVRVVSSHLSLVKGKTVVNKEVFNPKYERAMDSLPHDGRNGGPCGKQGIFYVGK